MSENINLVTFLDSAQRTIIGELVEKTEKITTIKNPVVVNIVPQGDNNGRPTGQMALQLIPVYFKEFQGQKTSPAVFEYVTPQITMITFDGGFDFRLIGQYQHIFNPPVTSNKAPTPPIENNQQAPVIKLFED